MGYLREKLKKEDECLYRSLENSWEVAFNEFLPALSTKSDSYHSFPHLRNVEQYLDKIFIDNNKKKEKNTLHDITPVEVYILLASVLFHDIGRIIADDENHAIESNKIIKNHWGELKIISNELAVIIGKICEFHNPPKYYKLPDLHTIVLDPYGKIRENMLAALLRLADHLDSTYTRVLPTYIKNFNDFEPVGAFRKIISGVSVVQNAQYIKTVINDYDEDKKNEVSKISYKVNREKTAEWLKIIKKKYICNFINVLFKDIISDLKKLFTNKKPQVELSLQNYKNHYKKSFFKTEQPIKRYDKTNINRVINNIKKEELSSVLDLNLFEAYNKKKPKGWEKTTLELVIKKLLLVEKQSSGKGWPKDILLAIILSDAKKNNDDIEIINNDLASIGIPIKKWLIEYKEQLYDINGMISYEPIFSKEYLINMTNAMYKLSSQIFGYPILTYEDLKSEVKEPDIEKVKMAVRRISILTEKNSLIALNNSVKKKEINLTKTIWYSSSNWQWLVENNQYNDIKIIRECLKKL